MRHLILAGILGLTLACAPQRVRDLGSAPVEATSLAGEPLRRPPIGAAARREMEAQLRAARRAYGRTPGDADSIIWLGRRTAYLGRYREAIRIFGEGIAKHPRDARMYRHRGHRYLTTRELDSAVADFERAYALVRGTPDQVEPDGMPNARNIPTSTLHGNIRYHLALAHYLRGDFAKALPIYREDLAASAGNPDMLVATSHWLYMTLRRMGRDEEAKAVLAPITRDMDVIENGTYHRLLLLYKGALPVDSLRADLDAGPSPGSMVVAYGIANWHLDHGRRGEADAMFQRIGAAPDQWPSFGWLAAEADRARTRRSP